MRVNHKRTLSFLIIFLLMLPGIVSAATLEAWVAPSNINLTIKAGESGSFDLVTTTGTPPIKKLDVVFAIDRTGSMTGVINQVKDTAINIMNNVKSKVPDSQFGVIAFQDYPGSYNYSGYSSTYGDSGDKVYEMLQAVTDNSDSITSAINSIYASGGADGPEAYTRVLYETGNGTPNWRADSKKVVILLGDAPTHDEDFAGFNNGGDPGPDGIANTADDLQFEDVVQDLNDKKITVLAIQASDYSEATATFKGASIGYGTAVGTAGQYFAITDITQVTTEIMKMVTEEVLNIKEMSLSVPDQYKSWFSTNPGNYLDVGPSASNSFNVTISVPAGTTEGEYSFPINVLGDGSVLSTANVKVTVTPGVATGSGVLEIASADYGVLENNGAANITINRSKGSTGEVSVNYITADGTAKAAQDYTETKGTVTFKDGEISKTISVPILDDTINDPNENFYFKINSPTGGATLGSIISSKITIADNEVQKPGVLEFSGFSYDVTSISDKAEITVTRTDGSDGAVAVNYATSNGTATGGVEYTETSGTLTFNSGEITKSFYVPINKAAVFSGSKNFNITLSNPTNGAMLGAKSTTVVNIQFVPLASSISIDPTAVNLANGAQKQLTVTAAMTDSSTKNVTNSSEGTTYTSNNTSVATVDANGLVTVAASAGIGDIAGITARYGDKTATCLVTVGTNPSETVSSLSITPATTSKGRGEQQQLQVIATMGDGSTKDVTSGSEGIVYTTNSSGVATVDANGLVTVGASAGIGFKATITAAYGGKTATSVVTVIDISNTVTSLSVTPATISKGRGQQQQLQVIATMGDGSTKDVTNGSEGTIYTTNSSGVATVDANGLVTVGASAGIGYKATITARYGEKTATSVVTVIDISNTITSLSVTPATISKGRGQQQQLQVIATMADGSTKDVTSGSEGTVYTTNSSGVATVDANGLVTVGASAGIGFKATITAAYGGKTATSVVTVVLDPSITVSSLSVTPATISKGRGQQQQLQVIATMGDGSTKDVTSGSEGTVYTTNSSGVATVDANGLVTVGSSAGIGYKATITAAYGGKTATSVVTVVTDPSTTVSSLSVIPATISKGRGQQQQLQVIATMGDGSTKDVTNAGTVYTTNSSGVATVDANGLVTVGSSAGIGYKATITAAYGGKTATSVVTVVTDPSTTVSSLSVIPATISKGRGQQQQLQVIATMGDGSTKDVTNAGTVYTTNSSGVATVDANGLVTVGSSAGIGYKATITATYGGKTATSVVTVVTDPSTTVSSLSVIPATISKGIGQQQQLQVMATMGDGSTKDVTNAGTVYTTNSSGVATVDANGLVTVGASAGIGYKATITATYGGKTATSVVTVVADPSTTVTSLSVIPATISKAAGQQQQLQVIATMGDGSTKDVTNLGTVYTTNSSSVATVDANGLVTVGASASIGFKATITATYGGKTATSVITVSS